MTEQFGSRGSGPTVALFQHMSTADGLKDLTMGELRSHFVKMERKDIVNILTKHKCEGLCFVWLYAVDVVFSFFSIFNISFLSCPLSFGLDLNVL